MARQDAPYGAKRLSQWRAHAYDGHMWRFYAKTLLRLPRMLWTAVRQVEGVLAVFFFFVLLFNESLGKKLMAWEGISPLWAAAPILIVFARAFLAAVYEEYTQLHEECDALRSDNRDLIQRLDDSGRDTRVREELGMFLAEGQKLYERLKRREPRDVFDACDTWYQHLVGFIMQKLGKDYLARLNDSTGMTFSSLLPQSGPKQEMEYLKRRQEKMHGLEAKMRRLNEFISELVDK